MKKILILLALVPMLHNICLSQTDIKFNDWFTDKTLRIDYLRIGSKQGDTVELVNYVMRPEIWAGSFKSLIDPFNNGKYQIKVQDYKSGKVIYTKGYNSLFNEYCDTPQGATHSEKFEEVMWIPYPLQKIKITLQKRDKKQKLVDQVTWIYDPQKAKTSDVKKIVSQKTDIEKLKFSGDPHNKLDLVIVAQGYSGNKEANADMKKLTESLFQQEPFKSHQNDFNVWGVTADVGASYNTFESDRYLMTTHLFKLHSAIVDVPYDHIIIMVNNKKYGGGAIYNYYAITSTNEMSNMILPHELGHSIGGLADEYVDEELSYNEIHPKDVEPLEPNITSLVDFDSKWKDMLPKGTPIPTKPVKGLGPKENGPLGVYEGGGYQKKGIYRPATNCMMNYYAEFCPVCTRRLVDVFKSYCQ